MTNSTGNTSANDLLSGDLWGVLFDPARDQLGEQLIAMFLVAIIVLPLLARGRSPFVPAMMLVLFSGMLIPMLPGMIVGVAWGVVWISGTIAIAGFLNRLR